MKNIVKSFLTNEIVINWVAPIITGLIVVAIPAGIIKIIQLKKDERKIHDANKRFLNSIRPYIIQGININSNFISDIRKVIVQESGVKDKFIYSEYDLRNKLIMDINESVYIDEKNKEKLINFTYETFKSFDNTKSLESKEVNEESKKVKFLHNMIFAPTITFIMSVIMMILISIFDNNNLELTENPIFALPFLLGFLSSIVIILSMILNLFESKVTRKQKFNFYDDYKLFYINQNFDDYIRISKKSNKNKK